MKKKIICLLGIIILTSCKSKDPLYNKWEALYDIGTLQISETYEFMEDGKCLKTVNNINTLCTYEFNDDKTKIRIIWDGKLDYDVYSSFEMKNNNEIIIDERVYKKRDN